MTALDELLARITAVLDECDADRRPPVIHHGPVYYVTDDGPRVEPSPVAVPIPVDQAAVERVTAELSEQITELLTKRRSRIARWLLGENRRRRA